MDRLSSHGAHVDRYHEPYAFHTSSTMNMRFQAVSTIFHWSGYRLFHGSICFSMMFVAKLPI